MKFAKSKPSIQPFIPLLLGFIAFIGITGGAILWPQNVDWLMDGDPATHWLGWQFFRHSPVLQWPLGANPDYGMEIGSSIVFTDSIPLMGFIFKPFSAFLPETFQYIGLWVLLCFMLQSYFGWKLLSLVTEHRWIPVLGSLFFTLAPVYLSRLGMHYALFGQWLIVAALYFYWSRQFSIIRWAVLITMAALVHAYLLAMVLAIWLTDLLQRRWAKEVSTVRCLTSLGLCLILAGLVMWAAGYFMLKAGVQSGGFGFYRMNLLGLIDSNSVWSSIMPDQPNMPGDYEGFSFLGAGVILLALIAPFTFLFKEASGYNITRVIPIASLSVLLFIYALSDHIAIGANESIQYSLPDVTKRITDTFRVSGRFIWPVYYSIYFGVIYLAITRLKPRIVITLFVALIALQVVDTRHARHNIKGIVDDAPTWQSPLRSPAWQELGTHYRKLLYVLPSNQPKPWLPLSEFAAKHHMAINIGYFARTNPEVEKRAYDNLIESIANNKIDPDALYIFENDYLWDMVVNRRSGSDLAGRIDGFRVLAPGLDRCSDCKTSTIDALTDAKNPRFDYAGGLLSFTSGGNGGAYQIYGWGSAENWGTWSSGKTMLLRVNLTTPSDRDFQLVIKAHGFVNERLPLQTAQVIINDQVLGTLKYTEHMQGSTQTVEIPKKLVQQSGGRLTIKFKLNEAASPSSMDGSADLRELALGVEALQIRPVTR